VSCKDFAPGGKWTCPRWKIVAFAPICKDLGTKFGQLGPFENRKIPVQREKRTTDSFVMGKYSFAPNFLPY